LKRAARRNSVATSKLVESLECGDVAFFLPALRAIKIRAQLNLIATHARGVALDLLVV
jgi:hypothetical protein